MTTNEQFHPLDTSADVVVSTCALRLSGKRALFADAFRALSSGGRFSITDVVVLPKTPASPATRLDILAARTTGAFHVDCLRAMLRGIGFFDVRIDIDVQTKGEQHYVLSELSARKP